MRIVHTFCGKLSNNSAIKKKVYRWMYALSAIYIKQNKDAKIILYVDNDGKEILDPILYLYDEVHIIEIPNYINNVFFAAIKYFALDKEPLGSIHIDGDVFIKTENCFNNIVSDFMNSDVIVQGYEPQVTFDAYCGEIDYLNKHNTWIDCDYSLRAVNMGVIGFNNETLKRTFIDNYYKFSKLLSSYNDIYECWIPDLILEQAYLSTLIDRYKYKCAQVLQPGSWSELSEDAIKKDYCHLLSGSKFRNIDRIMQLVKEKSIDVYNKLILF